jgi:hypothetical protein
MSNYDSTDRGSRYELNFPAAKVIGNRNTKFSGDFGILQHQSTLQVLGAMKSARQQKVALE